jgi:hypothetical protein
MKHEGPHSRGTSKEDAPEWWIKAYNDCLRTGIGVIVLRGNEDIAVRPLYVSADHYDDFGYELMHLYQLAQNAE